MCIAARFYDAAKGPLGVDCRSIYDAAKGTRAQCGVQIFDRAHLASGHTTHTHSCLYIAFHFAI